MVCVKPVSVFAFPIVIVFVFVDFPNVICPVDAAPPISSVPDVSPANIVDAAVVVLSKSEFVFVCEPLIVVVPEAAVLPIVISFAAFPILMVAAFTFPRARTPAVAESNPWPARTVVFPFESTRNIPPLFVPK